ncbi:MAG: 16S rRNA (guanine(527)-N(7))-methyltransferase RsmG [Erysipelotrichaceae bacterium]|nr:16S rRNA (guanine(527)-N(7))-methyltransferase RsmG [Erysipelotrichaceae bacterium]
MYYIIVEMELKDLNKIVKMSDEQLSQFDSYARFLVEYNEKINLTAITEYSEIVEKHFYDSLLLSKYRKMEGTLVDVGTGAGFPGVVLKIAYPELKVKLIEPLHKRCVFLNELIERLDLKDIEVLNVRAEDYSKNHREAFDFVTARAVTNLNALIELCGAMVKLDGCFIALRGKDGLSEIENAAYAINSMGFEVEDTFNDSLSDGSLRVISFFRKRRKTSNKYPRSYSLIKKGPICQK